MTLPAHHRSHSPSRQPDSNGWYVYDVGEEVRCPGPARRPGAAATCDKYMGTVEVGQMCVRIDQRREVGERRQHPRYTDTCPRNHGGCGSKLQIESRPASV